jgi:nucleoporin NUP82
MSPQQDYLAVLTSHTIHICILPDSSHLNTQDTEPFKAKFFTLGPTTHVTSRSAIVSAIWHPLGVNGSSLVTVTEDAVVRVWELSTTNRWSFDTPTLAIDLKKLADGTDLEQDFSASTSAINKGFSPDSFDMEVASACFPGRGSGGWSPMTLWVAMSGGDVYALCPLLPHKWAPPPTLIPSLSVSIVAKVAATEDDPDASPQEKLLAQQQLEWMSDLDNQEPRLAEASWDEPACEVYLRPSRPGTTPKLQGPFQIEYGPDDEQDDEIELRDIFVIGEKIDTVDLMMGEEEDLDLGGNEQGLSLSVICLLSTSGQVKICLDLDGVEAQWLPSRSRSRSKTPSLEVQEPSLLAFQTFDTMKPAELRPDCWPTFSEDLTSRYAFYVTHAAGITHVSLTPWVFRLESELQGESEAGAAFRMDLLVKGSGSDRERVYTHKPEQGVLAAVVAIRDPDLGYFVLSATEHSPIAIFFDMPEEDLEFSRSRSRSASAGALLESEEPPEPLEIWEPRPPFHPAGVFDREPGLKLYLQHLKTSKRMTLIPQEVRLSAATLDIFTKAHQVVSQDVLDLNQAIADLFRKCESLHAELREQVNKANEARRRIDGITGDDAEEGEEALSDNAKIQGRLREAKDRQETLAKRLEAVKRKLGRATTRELSDKEKAWIEEVRSMEETILGIEGEADRATRASSSKADPLKRFGLVSSLKDALLQEAQALAKADASDGVGHEPSSSPVPSVKVPSELRKAKVAQVMGMVDRESALIDAVKTRLERLIQG